VKQDATSAVIEAIKDSEPRLAQPQAKLSQFAFNLRRVRKVERGTMLPKHLDSGKEFGARLFGQIEHPFSNR
jgi:hypothetical protein